MSVEKLQPLTEQEKRFLEENHDIIYKFLKSNKYSIEEYYNIVVFGYLKAVQAYHRRKDLQQIDFFVIAWNYMRSEISNYFKMCNAKKRKADKPIISLDAEYAELGNLYNCIGGKSVEDELMESENITELLEILSESQRKIISLRMKGYANKEVIYILGFKTSTYYKEMQRIKTILEHWEH